MLPQIEGPAALPRPQIEKPAASAVPTRTRPARRRAVQARHARVAASANLPRLEDRSKLLQMRRWTRQIFTHHSERYLEAKTGRSRAWWGHIAKGNFNQLRPTLVDWYTIRAIAGIVSDESELDATMIAKLQRVMECVGALVVAVTDLIASVRRKSKG